jgi:hyperosmotically inducible protein
MLVLVLAGCQQKGTAEKAGQKIDQAAEEAGTKMGKAKESR